MKNFSVTLDLVKTNTLSPNQNYYFKIKEPHSLNPSAFGCKGAFFSIQNEALIYHNSNAVLHELHSKIEMDAKYNEMIRKKTFDTVAKEYSLDFVWWSLQGNMSYFLEYKIGKDLKPVHTSIFLHLKNEYCYRIDEAQNNFAIVDSLQLKDREYNEDNIITKLQQLGLKQQSLIKDKIPQQNFIGNLFKYDKWYPA